MLRPRRSDATRSQRELIHSLRKGEITGCQPIPYGSNYTFLLRVQGRSNVLGIYKPRDGEIPLWDFPSGTLYLREYASYLVASALNWTFVPPTVIRDGPYGIGSLQLFVEHETQVNPLTVLDRHPDDLRRICLFDWIANNADRKPGHCLLDSEGRVWGIDHGLTFNTHPKLRTWIWAFGGESLLAEHCVDLERLLRQLRNRRVLRKTLSGLLSEEEIHALIFRTRMMLSIGQFPGLE